MIGRRVFLGGAAAAWAAAARAQMPAEDDRRAQALRIRIDTAQTELAPPFPAHPANGDEDRYPSRIANFTKGLPHDDEGRVDTGAYSILLNALASGKWANFEAIPMGCPDPARQRKLTNPMSGLAFDLEGPDSHQLVVPPAPALASAEQAAEAVELYWKALARDVPFTEYESHPITLAAAAELSRLSGYQGPRAGGTVTPRTLFHGFTAGDTAGPYVSQFLLKPIAYGAQAVDQRVRGGAPGADYMTDFGSWLQVQNGYAPVAAYAYDASPCFLRNGRDLARWVREDVLFQAYFNACNVTLRGGLTAPASSLNPYRLSRTQDGFGTFGAPYMPSMVAEVSTRALKAVWYQKWFVHRRLRPEEYGGWVHNTLRGRAYPVHPDALNSAAVNEVRRRYGSALLPQAYPEGSPMHPSYGAGHATVAGACVTVLKALLDESFIVADPVVPSRDATTLERYTGPDADRLTVGGELNKLAANIALARNFAGIHWRSDYAQSLRLGETIALRMLAEHRATFAEDFGGFALTRFDGTRVSV